MNPAPLENLVVVVTRTASQAPELVARLADLGARVLAVPVIAIAPAADGGAGVDAAVGRIDEYDRIAIASPNAARALNDAVDRVGPTGPLPPVACVGQATAAAVDAARFTVDVVAERAIAESLVQSIGPAPTQNRDAAVLIVAAEVTRPALADGLTQAGWRVDRVAGYRTVDAQISADTIAALDRADAITFTSSSTVERFVRLVGADSVPATVACIGPITAATAVELGLNVTAVADAHTIDGLIDALLSVYATR